MDSKDLLVILGFVVTIGISVLNLIFTIRTNRRTSFVNTVTAERVKWIAKVRENVAKLLSLCRRRIIPTPVAGDDLYREIASLGSKYAYK